MNSYGHEVRMAFCANCGAPVTAPPAGGAVLCPYCNQQAQVPARDDSRDRAVAAQPPTMSEAQRFDRLRQQDGKPMLPPPSLQHLFQGGGLSPQLVPAAEEEWRRAHAEVRSGGGYPAEERLYHLTLGLNGLHRQANRDAPARALLESALDVMREPRHRQMFHAMLARSAARHGDVAGAEAWLATCTPYSDDLQTDTAWRFGRAYISTVTGDFPRVLAVLGSRAGDVPIDDSHDAIAAVFRANALERTGQGALAGEQLAQLAGAIGADTVEQIIALNQNVQPCPATWPAVRERQRSMASNVLVSQSGVKFGFAFISIFLGGIAMAVGLSLAEDAFSEDVLPWVIGSVVLGFIILTFVVLGSATGKAKAVAKRLKVSGVSGVGQVTVLATTGVSVNDQPQLEITFTVTSPGREPFVIKHREVINQIRIPSVQPGCTLPVRFDPNDPTLFAIAWEG
jgi:uncharacterized Zn finger protein (UPF0148 family)